MRPTTFGQQLREQRERAGMSQAELSRRAGLHPPAVTRLELYGDNATEQMVRRYAAALGLSVRLHFEER